MSARSSEVSTFSVRGPLRLLFVLRSIEVIIAVAGLGIAIETELPLDKYPVLINTGSTAPIVPILMMFSGTAMECIRATGLWIIISVCCSLSYIVCAVSTYAEMPTIKLNLAKQYYGHWIKLCIAAVLSVLLIIDCLVTVYLKFKIYMAEFKSGVIEEVDKRLKKTKY